MKIITNALSARRPDWKRKRAVKVMPPRKPRLFTPTPGDPIDFEETVEKSLRGLQGRRGRAILQDQYCSEAARLAERDRGGEIEAALGFSLGRCAQLVACRRRRTRRIV